MFSAALRSLFDRIAGLFRWKAATPAAPATPVLPDAPKKKRTRLGDWDWTLSDLLDSLDTTFEGLTKRIPRGAGLDRDSRTAFRKLGPLVVENGKAYRIGALVDAPEKIPTFIFVSMSTGGNPETHNDDDTRYYPEFVYIQRMKGVPYNVELTTGIVCQVSVGIRVAWSAKEQRVHGASRTYWCSGYASVDRATGVITMLQYRHPEWHEIRHRRGAPSHIRRESFDHGSIIYEKHTPQEVAEFVGWAIDAHQRIGISWTVGVRKSGARATFLVGPNRTKYYFKDRDRTALCPDGSRRRIVHYVKEHQRIRDGKTSTVHEHIRGASRFTWNGFECAVTAPKFNVFDARTFTAGGVDMEASEPIPAGLVSTGEAAGILADREDLLQERR
jgi:hypothetical protein